MYQIRQMFITPSIEDSDLQRRSRLLMIMLTGVGVASVVGVIYALVGSLDALNSQLILYSSVGVFAGIGVLWWLTRKGFATISASLFLALLSVAIAFGDSPEQVANGRTLFMFAVPILVSSVILPSYSSLITAPILGILISVVAATNQIESPILGVVGLIIIGLVAWISARSLENALRELRIINEDLDKRVEARTAELKITNSLLEEQIVERQRAAEALRIARDQALDASRFKTELLAKVSHELRTPLGVILGFAEMMTAGIYGPVTDKQQDILDKIIERDKRLTHLVGDLLDQSQFESRQIKLKVDPVMPRQIVENVCMSLQELADRKNVDLSVDIDEMVPGVLMGDGQRIEQIITNLVNNALKFTDEGYVHISASVLNDDQWVISVEDTGIGIPDKAQRYIFEAFRQVDGSATRNHEGFGLGLSIVKQLVDAMKGSIILESKAGKGSTFTVTLPLVTADVVQENVL